MEFESKINYSLMSLCSILGILTLIFGNFYLGIGFLMMGFFVYDAENFRKKEGKR